MMLGTGFKNNPGQGVDGSIKEIRLVMTITEVE